MQDPVFLYIEQKLDVINVDKLHVFRYQLMIPVSINDPSIILPHLEQRWAS